MSTSPRDRPADLAAGAAQRRRTDPHDASPERRPATTPATDLQAEDATGGGIDQEVRANAAMNQQDKTQAER